MESSVSCVMFVVYFADGASSPGPFAILGWDERPWGRGWGFGLLPRYLLLFRFFLVMPATKGGNFSKAGCQKCYFIALCLAVYFSQIFSKAGYHFEENSKAS